MQTQLCLYLYLQFQWLADMCRFRRKQCKYAPSSNSKLNQAQSEYKNVLANILRTRYDARMPPVEARSPDCRSNVENASHRRLVTGKPAMPTSHIRRAILRTPPLPRQPPVTGQQHAQTPPRWPFAICRHIAGWTQACNQGSRYVAIAAIATQPVPRLQICPIVHNQGAASTTPQVTSRSVQCGRTAADRQTHTHTHTHTHRRA